MKLEWLKRAKKRTTATAEVFAYDSVCKRYRVEVHKSVLACERGGRGKRKKRKETWYALACVGPARFDPVDSRQRRYASRLSAANACARHGN